LQALKNQGFIISSELKIFAVLCISCGAVAK